MTKATKTILEIHPLPWRTKHREAPRPEVVVVDANDKLVAKFFSPQQARVADWVTAVVNYHAIDDPE